MPNRPQLLIADPDTAHAQALCHFVQRFRLAARCVGDATALHQALADQPADLLVLDSALPGADTQVAVAALGDRLPLILTGRGAQVFDRVVGLEIGADDFLSKPFDARELVARVHSVLRRRSGPRASGQAAAAAAAVTASPALAGDDWRLDREERQIRRPDGRSVPLSEAECRVLKVLLQSPQRVFSRAQLASLARGQVLAQNGRSIDLLVSRLRHKLADGLQAPHCIQTVRGAGYVFGSPAGMPMS